MAGFCEICQIAEVLADARLQSGSVRITGRYWSLLPAHWR